MTGRAIRLRPVGVVRSRFKEPADLPPPACAPPRFFERVTGEIEVLPEFAEALDDIEGFSHIIVLFHFHRSRGAKLKAVPPGESRPRGIFSTRSPHRPNPLGLSVLKLLARDGRVLEVAGLDIVDGTPVLDIKPYTSRDRKSRIRTGWIQKRRRPAR
jgi:tRNA-Thr(GGU) m(6)t(6)A37 methyltransferase TsaA